MNTTRKIRLGISIAIFGVIIMSVTPFIQKIIIKNTFVLTPTSQAFFLWKSFPQDIPIDFYFFNWTNPLDIYNKSLKPSFQEVGPYRFLQRNTKSDIIFNKNGTVTFRQLRYWFFNNETVKSNLQDSITTLNPVALATAHVSRSWSYIVRRSVSFSLSQIAKTIHMTRTVREMLFDGYPDTLISIANTFPFFAGQQLPPWKKFGWFYERNGSSDFEGVFNMGTGVNSTLGNLHTWNYWTKTPYYKNNCGKLGIVSSGEFFEEFKGKKYINFWCTDLCRSLKFRFVKKIYINGISGDMYALDDKFTFDNGSLYKENKCYCNGECIPAGLVNVSSCRYGSPSFGSLPHFYQADPYYNGLIDGTKPNRKKHEFSIILEPITGAVLKVKARLQINQMIESIPGITMYENIPRIFIPMLWFEQKATLPAKESLALLILIHLPTIGFSLGTFLICLGFLLSVDKYVKNCFSKPYKNIQTTRSRTLTEENEKIALRHNVME